MSKSETMTRNTGTAGESDALSDKELETVAGGDPNTTAGLYFLRWLLAHGGNRPVPPPPDP